MSWVDPATLGTPTTGSVIGHAQADVIITDIQLDHAALLANPISTQSGTTYTLALADAGTQIEFTNASPVTLTIPTNASVAFPVGTFLWVRQMGAGQITVVGASGVTVLSPGGLVTRSQYDTIIMTKDATNQWVFAGTGTGTVPAAPTSLAAVAGDAQATITWVAPGATGGTPITGYVVTPFTSTNFLPPTTVGNVLTATITGLTNGTAYDFTVAAINTVGTGPNSTTSNSVTPISGTGTIFPSSVLDLRNFYLDTPVPNPSGSSPPNLLIFNTNSPPLDNGYVLTPDFYASDATHVTLNVPVNGATTSTGDLKPRTELREMYNNGTVNATWDDSVGVHTMQIVGSCDVLTPGRAEIIVGQVHDTSNDVAVLTVIVDGHSYGAGVINICYDIQVGTTGLQRMTQLIKQNYVLGTTYTIGITVTNNTYVISYNGTPITNDPYNDASLYFKVGNYLQDWPANYNPLPTPVPVGTARLQAVNITHNPVSSVDSTNPSNVTNSGAGTGYSTTTASAPGAPTSVVATVANASAPLTWVAPAFTGNATITGYVITPFIGATAQTATTVGNVLSATVTGLTNGTAYTFKVAAVNAIGTGTQSTASSAVTPSAGPALPSAILDLRNFYLDTPVASGSSNLTIKNSTTPVGLDAGYVLSPYFVASDTTHVVFSTPVNGATTGGSTYPRTELREMYNTGTVNASWDANSGTHSMTYIGSCDVLPGWPGTTFPPGKPQIVVGQIHNAGGNVLEILVDGEKGDGSTIMNIGYRYPSSEASTYLTTTYVPGNTFTITLTVTANTCAIYYNTGSHPSGATTLITTLTNWTTAAPGGISTGCYFKVGNYVQCGIGQNGGTNNYPAGLPSPVPVGTSRLQVVNITHTPFSSVDSVHGSSVLNSGAGTGYQT